MVVDALLLYCIHNFKLWWNIYARHAFVNTWSSLIPLWFLSGLGLIISEGRTVAQAVSRWLLTAAARVRVRATCGVCGGQSGIGAGFLWVLRFPLSIIPPISPSSYSPGAGTIGQLVAAVPSGPNWTPPPPMPIKKNWILSENLFSCKLQF
jgi:hypothetical protein